MTSSSSWPGCLSNSVTHFFSVSPLFGVQPVFLWASVTGFLESSTCFLPSLEIHTVNCCFWLASFTSLSKSLFTCARAKSIPSVETKTRELISSHTQDYSQHILKWKKKRTDLLSGVNGRGSMQKEKEGCYNQKWGMSLQISCLDSTVLPTGKAESSLRQSSWANHGKIKTCHDEKYQVLSIAYNGLKNMCEKQHWFCVWPCFYRGP